ncbi:hypothetical protein GO986_18685 [Deinococcus sp. HMF7620]|uniref:Uncharacterized protein n=1 Tax=Deinococcus arboris TaxID=2682977 RepID=A0A7C9HTQ8_9DEIO|nr:hypothetical protein [Deinococcus arboris]MVN88769.1 hypothetical protein [Deinococcus arboris]
MISLTAPKIQAACTAGPPLPDPHKAHVFFQDLAALATQHGFILGRATWETPERAVPHFQVQIIAPATEFPDDS